MIEEPSAAPGVAAGALAPTRGERNNNPGNLDFEEAVPWLGQLGLELVPEGESYLPRFARFDTAINGIRALARELLTYSRVHHCGTCRAIVDRWAPPAENDTGAYVADVAARLGVDPGATLDLGDPALLASLAAAIIVHENGRCLYDAATLAAAVKAALAASLHRGKEKS